MVKNEWQYEVRKAVVESRGCGVGHLMRENWGGGKQIESVKTTYVQNELPGQL